MPPFASSALFYAVLIAPGFLTVFTAISVAAIERDHSEFVLLVWSLVMSLIIDTIFLTVYQIMNEDITSIDQLPQIFFDPHFHYEYVFAILTTSIVVGVIGAGLLILELPDRFRRRLQSRSQMAVNPRQPWNNFLRDTDSVRIITTDGENYEGLVLEWSRAGRPKQLRILDPHRYEPETNRWVRVGPEEMLFLEDDIQRVMMREIDEQLPFWNRILAFFQN